MGQLIDGAHHLPFEHLITEGAYQVGATYERSNINKRIISFPVILGGPKYSAHAYRMIETNFWDSLPHDKPFWLGCHTMFGGWRWIEVRLAEVVKTPMKIDSVAFQNNTMQWEIKLLACKPWYAKRMLIERWTAHPETVAARGFDEETISIANRGDMPARFLAMYTGPGRAWIQDGITSRMVELPLLTSKDGYALVDSNEGRAPSPGPPTRWTTSSTTGSAAPASSTSSSMTSPPWGFRCGGASMSGSPAISRRAPSPTSKSVTTPRGSGHSDDAAKVHQAGMTSPLDALYTGVEGLIQPPLEFTRHLAGALQSHVIGALDKPLPQQDPLSAYRYLNARRQTLVDSVKQRPLIRMQDKNYKQLATLGGRCPASPKRWPPIPVKPLWCCGVGIISVTSSATPSALRRIST